MTATITRTGSTVDAIDLFCGYGGSSQGIHAAGATVRAAANHSQLAIDCHQANFPDVEHFRADMVDKSASAYVDPEHLPPARFMWASPSCKDHSQANAKKLYKQGPGASMDPETEARYHHSERSRVTMCCPLRYAAKHHPEIVVVENVVDVAWWGPAKPGKSQGDGTTFAWWLNEWTKIGYEYEALFLNSQFFAPCPQSRDRIYIVFWRKGNTKPDLDYRPTAFCMSDHCGGKHVEAVQTWKKRTAAWPTSLPVWGKYKSQYTYNCPDCSEVVDPFAMPAYTAIDWTDLGPRVGDRKTPLAVNTLDRIRRGIHKFAGSPHFEIPNHGVASGVVIPTAGNTFERPGQTRAKSLTDPMWTMHTTASAFGFAHTPFITEMRGGGSIKYGHHSVLGATNTVTAGGMHHGLVSTPAMFTKINGGPGDTAWHPVTDQFGTITARDTTGLVVLPWVDQYLSDPAHLTKQIATLMTHARTAYVAAEDGDVDIDNVHFRMLRADPELRRISAFGDEYILLGTQTQMTEGLGNAVTPPVATWITGRALATLDEKHSPNNRLAEQSRAMVAANQLASLISA